MGKTAGIVQSYPQLSSAPTTPASNYSIIYPKTDGKLYIKNSDGVEYEVIFATVTQTLTNKTLQDAIYTRGIRTSGSAPTVAGGTGAGTSPTITMTGNDICGYITVVTGTTPTGAGIIATITFNTTLSNAPKSILITPGNTFAGGGFNRFFVDQTASTTSVWVLKNTATVLSAGVTYILYYLVIE